MKRNYNSPHIEEILLDKAISLQLQSNSTTPPGGPGEDAMNRVRESDPYQYDGW